MQYYVSNMMVPSSLENSYLQATHGLCRPLKKLSGIDGRLLWAVFAWLTLESVMSIFETWSCTLPLGCNIHHVKGCLTGFIRTDENNDKWSSKTC